MTRLICISSITGDSGYATESRELDTEANASGTSDFLRLLWDDYPAKSEGVSFASLSANHPVPDSDSDVPSPFCATSEASHFTRFFHEIARDAAAPAGIHACAATPASLESLSAPSSVEPGGGGGGVEPANSLASHIACPHDFGTSSLDVLCNGKSSRSVTRCSNLIGTANERVIGILSNFAVS